MSKTNKNTTNKTGQKTQQGRLIDHGLRSADELGLVGMSMITVVPMHKQSKTPKTRTPQEPPKPLIRGTKQGEKGGSGERLNPEWVEYVNAEAIASIELGKVKIEEFVVRFVENIDKTPENADLIKAVSESATAAFKEALNNQADVESEPEYPEPFESDVLSTGGLIVDNGMFFTLEVDDSGFHLRKDLGGWSVSDLFGEMNWWPTDQAWQGQNKNLLGLLDDLAPKVGVAATTLLDIVREYLEEYGGDADIQAYLTDERSQAFSLARLRRRHAELVGNFRIPGLPSDDLEEGSSYRGLELAFGTDGWSAILWEPSYSDHVFSSPEYYDGDTLDEILDHLPWDRDKLVEVLVEADPCWEHFIDKDFST
jgi:hypothetical protein